MLEDEEVRLALAGEAEHVAVVVFNESAESFTIHQFESDGALLFGQPLEVCRFLIGGLRGRRFLLLRIGKWHRGILRSWAASVDHWGGVLSCDQFQTRTSELKMPLELSYLRFQLQVAEGPGKERRLLFLAKLWARPDSEKGLRSAKVHMEIKSTIHATRVAGDLALDAAHPAAQWRSAEPVRFSADWQGNNADPPRETEVRVLWSPEMLYLRFMCRYRELFVFADSDPNGRRDHLWDRDVAEAFLQPPPAVGKNYKEFEVAPNGMWIDLDIFPEGLADLKSGLTRSVFVDAAKRVWTAEVAIPMKSLTAHFDAAQPWRANFYRVEGKAEPRKYLAWQPTDTAQPNFHVPEKFGNLRFAS